MSHKLRAPLLVLVLCAACASPNSPQPAIHAFGAPQSPAFASNTLFVFDNGNASTCADDRNTCTSSTCGAQGSFVGPCKTYGAILQRLGGRPGESSVYFPNKPTILSLSDQTPGVDVVDIAPSMASSSQWLTISGTLIQTGTATIGTFTPRAANRLGNPNRITAAGQSGAFWAPFVGQLVHDATANGWFRIEKDLGTATAQISEPVPSVVDVQFPILVSYVTIAANDALVILRPSLMNCGRIGSSDIFSTTLLEHVTCTGTGASSSIARLGVTMVTESTLDANTLVDGCSLQPNPQRAYNANDFIAAPTSTFAGYWQAGAFVGSFPGFGCQNANDQRGGLDSDVLLDFATSWHATAGVAFGRVYLGAGTLLDTDGSGRYQGGSYDGPGLFYPDVEIWGPGHFDMHDGAQFVCNTGCTQELIMTGGLTIHNGGSSQAYPWNASTHSWGALATISGPAIDDAGSMCDLVSGDCYRIKQ